MIRILVVDDSAVIREGLRSLLSSQPDFLLVGEAADGLEAVASVRDLEPHVVTMDARMPCMDGVEATRYIRETGLPVGIILLSVFDDCAEAAMAAGVDTCLLKDCEARELFATIRQIADRVVGCKEGKSG